jgi:hypothetical protein
MNSSSQISNARRNLRALFVLALLLTLLLSVCGGYMLIVGHSHPAVTLTLPTWEYGQFLLLYGLTNLFVYACIFLQVRGLTRAASNEIGT